eukprot:Pgem_evm1s1818
MSLSVVDKNDSETAKSISSPVNNDDLITKSASNYDFCIKDQLNKKNANMNNYGFPNEDTSGSKVSQDVLNETNNLEEIHLTNELKNFNFKISKDGKNKKAM